MRTVRLFVLTFAACMAASLPRARAITEAPVKISVCQLLSDREAYDRKLVEVTGFASHGFEDSAFSDPQCNSRYSGLWMEYGAKRRTGTMSTASGWNREGSRPTTVEGIEVPLVEDDLFKRFDDVLHQGRGATVHATVVARFFAGHAKDKNSFGAGYGHMGCCSLFVIQQVLTVDDERRANLDYDDSPEQPKADCFRYLTRFVQQSAAIAKQKATERDYGTAAFPADRDVATEVLLKYSHAGTAEDLTPTKTVDKPYHAVFQAQLRDSSVTYTVVLSKPAWLSYYAADPAKVAWVVLAAYATCDKMNAPLPTTKKLP